MDIEMIERLLTNLAASLEELSETAKFSVLQSQLLLHIYKKLENIESDIASMSADSWSDHYDK